MKPILRIACAACLWGTAFGTLWAQAPAMPESLSAWPYYKELATRGGPADIMLDRDVLDKARADQADLRIYDSNGREIPYVLGIRRDIDSRKLFTSREFNRAVEGTAAVVSCDLGAQPLEHNQVLISTTGNNFRRLAEVSGSPDGAQWSTLVSQAILFRFAAGGRTVEQNSVSYPVSRFRYVRVRVERDPQVDREAPEITSLGVLRSVQAKGVNLSFDATTESREADPVNGRPASIWRIDLGARIPLQGLTLNVGQPTFSRPFQLDIVDDPQSPVALASGDLIRTEENANEPARIDFREQSARHLKLTITDDRNPALSLSAVTALSAAREMIFDAPAGTLRLYYGNPRGIAPHYDAAVRADDGNRRTLGPEKANPTWRPEPKPFSERSPWLVYIVLGGACAALAGVLLNLARNVIEPRSSPG